MADEPFEQKVAAKLESLLLRQQGEDSPNPENWDSGYARHLANYLAPYVVKAIEAAQEGGENSILGSGPGGQELALAALRGRDA